MDAYLNAVLETNDIPEGTVYADALVKDLDTAMWAFKKIKAIKAKEEEINKAAEEEVKRIKEWQEKEVERLMADRAFFESALTAYYMVEKKRDKRFRLTTPYGHISARKQQPEFKYDKDSLLTWLKDREYKQYIDAKEEPKWVDFKKSLTLTEDGTKAISADGEIIDIIEVQQRDDKVSVEVV